jgi:S-(hydroxymethyl)glutathione dehydrogenase/alcohol dehydrogenase
MEGEQVAVLSRPTQVKTMKAAVLVELGKPLILAELELPSVLNFGQVLVKVLYSGICGAQLNEIDGIKGPDAFLPHLLGHEGSAIVLEVGPGVKTVKKGDHVVMHWRPSAGLQSETPNYRWNGRHVNAGWVTTFNDYAIVSENRLTAIPDDFDMRLAPLFGCAITTALGVVNNEAHVKIGQSVVVMGVGGVGLNIVQAAEMVSANPIIGVDLYDSKLNFAKKFGATHIVHSKKTGSWEEEIRKIVGSKGADVVFDTTGNGRVVEAAYQLTHPQGRTILVGVPAKGDNISINSFPLNFKKILQGTQGGSSVPDIEIPRYIQLYKREKLNLKDLITHEFKLEDINQAIKIVRSGDAGRVIISMGHS